MRKFKIPGDDGTGKDTYTWHLGFSNSIIIFTFFVSINIFLFYKIITIILGVSLPLLIFVIFFGIIFMFLALTHWTKKQHFTNQLLQIFFIFTYGILNLIIYFANY
jgi:hypothetical protein